MTKLPELPDDGFKDAVEQILAERKRATEAKQKRSVEIPDMGIDKVIEDTLARRRKHDDKST